MSGDIRGRVWGGSSKEQQGLIRGFCGFAEMKDGQGDEDREELGQVGRARYTHLPAVARRPSPGLELHVVLDVVGYLGDGPGYVAPMGLYVGDLE